jgi:hypothetical protein
MSVESILSEFSRLAPFNKDLILQTLKDDLEIVKEKADPLVIDLLQRNLSSIQSNGKSFTHSSRSKSRKTSRSLPSKKTRKQSGGMLSGIVGWTIAAASFVSNYHGADRNMAIMETLGIPYMTSQMAQSGIRTIQELVPMNEMMDRILSYMTPNPVIPEDVFKAGFETMYELEPYTQQDTFFQTKRHMNSMYTDLNTEIIKDFTRLVMSESYLQDKKELEADLQKHKTPKESKGFLSMFTINPIQGADESLQALMASKEMQLSAYSMNVGLNTTAVAEILTRVLNTTNPSFSMPSRHPLEYSTNLVVYEAEKETDSPTFRNIAVNSQRSPKATVARYKLPVFSKHSMKTRDFLHQVLNNVFTLPPLLTEKNTLVLPQEFTLYHEYITETLNMNKFLTEEEKRIILNIFSVNYMGICSRIIDTYETSMANTEIQNVVRALNETHIANLQQIKSHCEGKPELLAKVNGWVDTHLKTFGFITNRVKDEIIHCSKVDVCPMLTYKEVKNEKIILQKLHSSPYDISSKVLFSMMVTAIVVGIPAMLIGFVFALANRTIDAHLAIVERFGLHKNRLEQQKLEFNQKKQMVLLEDELKRRPRGRSGSVGRIRSSSKSSKLRLRNKV